MKENKNHYNGYTWATELVAKNHLVINSEDCIIFYLPAELTERQYNYIKEHKKEYKVYKKDMLIYNMYIENGIQKIGSINSYTIENINCLELLYDLIEEKYKRKEEDDKYVQRVKYR